MEEAETATIMSRKELRKQKFMEYLAAKGKLNQPNSRSTLCHVQTGRPVKSGLKNVKEKENKAPSDRFRVERTKATTLLPESTTHNPSRKALGITYKVNVKDAILTQCNGQTQAKKTEPKPVLTTKTSCVMPAKPDLNTAGILKKQTRARAQSTTKPSSTSTTRTVVTKSSNNSRVSSRNSNFSHPIKTSNYRMSLGPMVKTKTGLMPAILQPRNEASGKETHAKIPPSLVNKAQSTNSNSSDFVARKSAVTQRRTLPAAALKSNPVKDRISMSSVTKTGIKVQALGQKRSNPKPLLAKCPPPSCSTKPSGPKSTSTVSSKPAVRVVSSKIANKGDLEKRGQLFRASANAPSGKINSCIRHSVAKLGDKNKNSEEESDKKAGQSSWGLPKPLQTATAVRGRAGGIPTMMMSRTEPPHSRTVSFTGRHTSTKKLPLPQTDGKKLTAVQEERVRKLQEWREARGISYKRPPMPVKAQVRSSVAVPQPFWTGMEQEDEAQALICAVDRSLQDCIKLLAEGCPSGQVQEVLSRLPAVSHKFSKYWICRARLLAQEGDLNVLPMFEEAVGVVLEPVDELRSVVFEILKRRDEIQAACVDKDPEEEETWPAEKSPEAIKNPLVTPKAVRALIKGETQGSSVVKYKITATPGGPPSHHNECTLVNGQEVRFFTPVRRSVRIQRSTSRYPSSLQEHDLCVSSYSQLLAQQQEEHSQDPLENTGDSAQNQCESDGPMYVYRENEALRDKVSVQLVYSEDS